jgi:signal transduction histidine kinase
MFFYKNIVSRIRNLEENSRLLGEGRMVAAPESGKDEIARLHRSMHRASVDLNQAAREKQKVAIMLSHDLRSPLMSIQGNIALVVKGIYGTLNKEGLDRLEIAESSLDRLVSMITQFLDTEKFKDAPLDLEPTELGKIFAQTMQMLGSTTSNTKVICRSPELKLTVDVSLMVRVLTNLIGNAIKFSPQNASIIVSGSKADKGVEILVSDEGPGIPEELQGSIFEPYVQTPEGKRVPKSSGLGLSICKEIVTQHGGQIGVKNNDGAGTTFSIVLPIVE